MKRASPSFDRSSPSPQRRDFLSSPTSSSLPSSSSEPTLRNKRGTPSFERSASPTPQRRDFISSPTPLNASEHEESLLLRSFLSYRTLEENRRREEACKGKRELRLERRFDRLLGKLDNFRLNSDKKSYINKPLTLSEKFKIGHFSCDDQEAHGDVLFNRVIKTLGEFTEGGQPFVFRPEQQRIINSVLGCFLPLIYGDTFESNRDRLLRKLRLDRIREELIVMAGRRVGKTTCIAAICAAILIVVPRCTGAIFSLAQRASTRLMGMIKDFLRKHPIGSKMLDNAIKSNEEMLVLVGEHPSHIKVLYAFPDKSDVCFFILILNQKKKEEEKRNEKKVWMILLKFHLVFLI